jgi:hypothetical protein
MAHDVSSKTKLDMQARTATYNVLCGIVKLYGEATLVEIRAKYRSIARPWNLPIPYISEESARAYLNQGVKHGLLRYERRQRGVVTMRRLHGMSDGTGYYIWIDDQEKPPEAKTE